RFFRMAERRIAKTGQGVVCFISNYSWLDGLSFTGMRERYLEAFDAIRIDCLNGDKYKTGKVAPDGSPDPSIFSTESDPVGIQVGTAITTLVRNAAHVPTEEIGFRHLWGQAKREELIETEEIEPDKLYEVVKPVLPLGLPFVQTAVSEDWFNWPALPDLFPVSFPGVKTSRDSFLVDTDLDRLKKRIGDYFDGNLSHDEITQRYPGTIKSTALRDALLERGGPIDANFIRFSYRPFDIRWLYWEAESSLLDRPRPDYKPHVFKDNVWLEAREREAREDYSRGTLVRHLSDNFGNGLSSFFPAYLLDDSSKTDGNKIQRRPNLSGTAQDYLQCLGADVDDLFHHVLATLHDPIYREANVGALRMEWPRIPLPGWHEGNTEGAVEALVASAARGRELAALLDPETPVPGITTGTLRPEVTVLAVPATTDGRNMTGKDFELTADWGHYGTGKAVMPGQGYIVEREYTPDERTIMGTAIPTLGEKTLDVYLNKRAFWRNVPAAIWNYKLGGYQVLKKWLSYREQAILDRPLLPEEVMYFTEIARRIAMIITTTQKSTESLTKEGS
ncbi:MAG: DNA methyltransferase, partial [Gammaproteobacteria bacterium]|nr:DNA methyltransferase [Gammaproteobacteria bacterium]